MTDQNPPAVADPEAGTVTRTVLVRAAQETVFELLTSSEAIEQWWGHPNEFPGGIVPGSRGTFWHGETTFPMQVDAVEPPHRFDLTWGSGREIDEEASHISFTLEPAEDGTLVTVTESGFDATAAERRAEAMAENVKGWTLVLDSFVRCVEGRAGA